MTIQEQSAFDNIDNVKKALLENGLNLAHDVLHQAESVLKKSIEERRLIPVTERMPDIGVPFLTFDGYTFHVEKRIEWIWGDNEKIYSEWWIQGYDADNENPIGLRDGAVTAWMPLPTI